MNITNITWITLSFLAYLALHAHATSAISHSPSCFPSLLHRKTAFALHWYVWTIPHMPVRPAEGEHMARSARSIYIPQQSTQTSRHIWHLSTAFQDFITSAAERMSAWCARVSIHNRLVAGNECKVYKMD